VSGDSRVGTELGGYRIEAVLGRGGMSVVYLATDLDLERKVALKFLAPELAEQPGFRERFIRESRLAASIDHPNVIPVYEAGETDEVLFIAMRYVRGTDLRTVIGEEGGLDPSRAVSILSQVAAALDAAHAEGLVHRDVKPANVLLTTRSEPEAPEHVYLTDFGVTKRRLSAGGLTATGQLVGTVDYVAPEQIEGKDVDGRADVYSLGCMAFECLTGRPPFVADTEVAVLWAHVQKPPPSATEVRPELPPAVDGVLARAMAKRLEGRYDSAGRFAADLAAALRPGPRLPIERPLRPQGWLVGAAVGLVVAVALGVYVLTRPEARQTSARPPGPAATPISGNLLRVDLATARITDGITVPPGSQGSGGEGSLAVGSGFVWVASRAGLIKVNDAGSVIATLTDVPAQFGKVAAGSGSVWLATPQLGQVPEESGMRVLHVDPTTNTVVAEIRTPLPIQTGSLLAGTPIAVSEEAVWVTDERNDRLLRIDPRTNRIIARIPLPANPSGVAVGDDSVWVRSNDILASAIRIDPATNSVIASVQLPGGADGMAVGAGSVWVSDSSNDTVVKIDARTNSISRTIDVGVDPQAIVVDPDGNVWVSNQGDATISKVNGITGEIEATSAIPTAGGGEISVSRKGLAVGLGSLWVT
jgi:serine/threonine-protein kinase